MTSLPQALLDALRERYAEPWRHYHTLRHIESLLGLLEAHRGLARHGDELAAAIWFHDAIYDPRRNDNEARSAELAREQLPAAGCEAGFADRVAELVLATRSHEADPADGDKALLLDLDLSILAAAPVDYDRYALQVRQEYAHVADDAFRNGRARVLGSFLARPRLFILDSLFERWEAPARQNLRREIEQLG